MFIRTIYYVNVGNLPKTKAVAWLNDLKEIQKVNHNEFDRPTYIAVRDQENRIERFVIPESGGELKYMVDNGIPFRV